MENIQVGSRIESDGHYATVKFLGEVPPTAGLWVGVEWDDPTRGKHDGCYDDVRFFSTSRPNAGSFLRPKKCNAGVAFVKALAEKYGVIEDEDVLINDPEMFVQGENRKTRVEMVGVKKVNLLQSQFDRLTEVSLRGMYVNGAGPDGDVAKTAPNVRTLDLAVSLIPSWEGVAKVVRQMKSLRDLNVSGNRFEFSETLDGIDDAFVGIRTLYANHTNDDWTDVRRTVRMFTRLEQLHVCYNRIGILTNPTAFPEHLTLLNLEGNALNDWTNVLVLSDLVNLEVLILNRTDLGEISFPRRSGASKTDYFPKLASLSLSGNRITDWSSINELNRLESLTVLRFTSNPLVVTAGGPSATRHMIVAKLEKVKVVNNVAVSPGERQDAEIDYIKFFGMEWKNAGGSADDVKATTPNEDFVAAHPRYLDLVRKRGAAEDSEMTKAQSSALKNSLITVKMTSPLLGDVPAITKKLPTTMTVQKLKALAQRLFRVPDASGIKVTYVSQKMVGPEIELDNNLREISFYSVEDGDTIYVHW